MKTKLESIINLLIFTPAPPIAGFLAGWVLVYYFMAEKWFLYFAFGGLVLGLLADIPIAQCIIKSDQPIPLRYGILVIVFYAFVLLGVFMGVPIFHVILSLPAAFLVASCLARLNATEKEVQQGALRTAIATTTMYDLVFIASAFFALVSPSTPTDLQGMLGLNFEVTQAMILTVIFVGGFILLFANFFVTRELTRYFHRLLSTS